MRRLWLLLLGLAVKQWLGDDLSQTTERAFNTYSNRIRYVVMNIVLSIIAFSLSLAFLSLALFLYLGGYFNLAEAGLWVGIISLIIALILLFRGARKS